MKIRVGDEVAVRLLIDEIPPPADALRQDHAGNETVCRTPEADLMNQAEQDDAERTADHAAVDREPAVAEMQPIAHVAVKRAVIGARADDAKRQDADKKIERPFRRNVAPFEQKRNDDRRQDDAAYDDDGIIVDSKAEDRDAGIARRQQRKVHAHSPFSAAHAYLFISARRAVKDICEHYTISTGKIKGF